ncbi:hypothetical protein [Microvirga sp. BSC39]|uniref:hypothetical protein n=1 Tax=Microvirga sp. BSC39 TaxID=1549810 RepID=UPI001FCA5323|nr:hypothetical protein [Microvirga sp. BSC39]
MAVRHQERTGQVPRENERIEYEPLLDQRPEGWCQVRTDEPIVVGNVLQHRAEPNDQGERPPFVR